MDLVLWKKRKKELKLTFDALSNNSNVPKRTLEDIFSGRTPSPRIDTVQAIERALGISDDERLTDTQKESITPLEMLMLETYRQIGAEYGEQGQERAIEILKTIFNKGAN